MLLILYCYDIARSVTQSFDVHTLIEKDNSIFGFTKVLLVLIKKKVTASDWCFLVAECGVKFLCVFILCNQKYAFWWCVNLLSVKWKLLDYIK